MSKNPIEQSLLAGEIVLSDHPGTLMKQCRSYLGVSQSCLARRMNVTQATLSGTENNKRKNPGSMVIARFVKVLFELKEEKK